MKLAAITIAYNSDTNELRRNIASYIRDVDVMILWDNSEQPLDLSSFQSEHPQIVIHQDGVNYGLPKAYNWAIDYAKRNGCTHLMTMDQDSCFEGFIKYRHWIETCNLYGIYSPAINQSHPITGDYIIINDSAQSGSVYPLSMIDELGPFREDFFIGMVDAEICLRAQEKGYRTFRYNGCNLIHHIGSGRKVKLFGHSLVVSDYNALRHYYDSRNRILMWYEFPYDFTFKGKMKYFLSRLKVMVKILLFEKNKCAKLSAILRGTFWGLCNQVKPF